MLFCLNFYPEIEDLSSFLETSKIREMEALSQELTVALEDNVRLSKEMQETVQAMSKMKQTVISQFGGNHFRSP